MLYKLTNGHLHITSQDAEWKVAVLARVVATYSTTVQEMIAGVVETEAKLMSLKRGKSGGSDDTAKVKMQCRLDAEEIKRHVNSVLVAVLTSEN